MNFKRFHESKNLLDLTALINAPSGTFTTQDRTETFTADHLLEIQLKPNTYYKMSSNYVKTGTKSNIIYLQYADSSKSTTSTVSPSYKTNNTGVVKIAMYTSRDGADDFISGLAWVMLNEGSTALPYEPYSSEVWHDIPYYQHKTATDTLSLPAVIYPNDTSITVGLKGNEEHTGTPTPQNPVVINGCGDMTENLFDKTSEYTVGATTYNYTISGLDPNKDYTCSTNFVKTVGTASVYFNGGSSVYNGVWKDTPRTTRPNSSGEIVVYLRYRESEGARPIIDDVMAGTIWVLVNEGSTPLPYGYKIPISSAEQTTPVYLGEVQSTRRIKKLVLTGQENWFLSTAQAGRFGLALSDYLKATGVITSYCSHYEAVAQKTSGTAPNNSQYFYSGSDAARYLFIVDTSCSTAADFKTYLQQQYATGTPVTVWYVLATEETAVVNEPLRKIGDYADTVSGITIPTIAGANTISVDTTLQPSEVSVNYKGWHPVADVHVYPDSSWMPTSWEEFRKAVRSGKAQSLYPVGTKLYENWGDTTSDAWIVVDYPTGEDYLDSDLAQQGYTNRVMLMEEKLNYLRQFDAIEAWLYVETAIPVGTYRFTIPNYDASYGGNKTYIFTSTANVPVGGQLTLTWSYQQNPSAVQAYSSATSTSALFNVSITEWDGTTACTDLGTIKLAQNDADSTYGKLNHIHRARYGSNNYYQSGYRQWLNTNASANWWTPTNVFDRPYGNRTNAGRLNVMNSNMKSVLATPTVNCITNNLFEYPSLDGTTFSLQTAYTVTDKLFPVTHSEINLSSSPNVNSVLDYYVSAQNADRIKYRKDNGNAYYWWLRTPYPTNANYVRSVSTSGALSNYGAINTYGSAAACIIQ